MVSGEKGEKRSSERSTDKQRCNSARALYSLKVVKENISQDAEQERKYRTVCFKSGTKTKWPNEFFNLTSDSFV